MMRGRAVVGDKVWHKQLNTTMTTNSSTPPIEPEEMDEGHGESLASENPLRRKFQELSREKQFGLITLAALGTAMLVTGRTVRIIMKRMAPVQSLPHPPHGFPKNTSELLRTRM
ncbi:hypothetical protein VP01_3310g1, partial [Puccinia sorghi]